MNRPITDYARLGLVHHMLYPDCGEHPDEHVATLKALAAIEEEDARLCTSILQRATDCPRGPLLGRHHDIGRVRGHGKAHHLGQDLGAACPGVLIFLEDKDRRSLALHHAVAVGTEGAAGIA